MIIRTYYAPDTGGGGSAAAGADPAGGSAAAAGAGTAADASAGGGAAATDAGGGTAAGEGAADLDPGKGTWLAQLTKETWAKYKTELESLKEKKFDAVLEEYITTKGKLGAAIIPPAEGASADEVKAFLAKMDIPETAEGYELDPKKVQDSTGEFTQALAANMRRMGLTKKQGQQVFAQIAGLGEMGIRAQKQAFEEEAKSFDRRLALELGNDPVKSTETKEHFKRFLTSLGDKELLGILNSSGILYNTRYVRAMAAYHRKNLSETPYIGGHLGGRETKQTGLPVSAQFQEQYGKRG